MKKNLVVKQHDIKDCGICCLESIIIYYGGYIPLEYLRLQTKTNNNGTTAFNLIKTAKEIGFDSKGIKTKDINKNEIILPAIAHIETSKGFNHFVVVYKITKNHVYIMDPAHGFKKQDIETFKKEWTNVLLLFKPFKTIPLNNNKEIKQEIINNLIEDNKKIIYKLFSINIIVCILSILSSYYLKILMNYIEEKTETSILFIIVLFAFITMYKILYEYIKNELLIYLNKNIDCTLIPEFIDHIIKLPSNVISSHTSGEILTRINALKETKELISEVLISILLNITLSLTTIYFLVELNNKLFLILCLIIVIYVLICLITNKKIIECINDNIDSETEFNSFLVENIDSIETINNLNIKNYKINEILNKYYEYIKRTFNYSNVFNKIISSKNMINELGTYLITSIGILLIINNKITLLSLVTFISLMNYFLEPIESIMNQIPLFNKININLDKISDFINIKKEVEEEKEFINGNIIIENLSYSFNDYDKILSNINIRINEKDKVEIKGPSGCGKSTICRILNQTINDYKGNIKINNIDIKNYSPYTIRKNIVYVSQREKLFTDTIRNNIVLDEYINEKELSKIIEMTCVNEIINKKGLKLDSIIYDSGINLSGGERQRIVLARSIIRRPKILILDEALSEIEKVKEIKIMKRISNYLKDSTIIYISHNDNNIYPKKIYIRGKRNDQIINV